MTQPPEPLPNEGTTVSEEEIASAMGVNSVPDETRVHSDAADETNLVIGGSGVLGPPAEEEPKG